MRVIQIRKELNSRPITTNSLPASFLHQLGLRASYTLSEFEYGDFQKENTNFTGNRLPGVPQHAVAMEADLRSGVGLYFRANCYLASKIFLNDANTAVADPYQLVD